MLGKWERAGLVEGSEYPTWLWSITRDKTLGECEKVGYHNMKTMAEKRRYVQLLRTKGIKDGNFDKGN